MDFRNMARRGVMIVLSSPSGAGKTSIARELIKSDSNIKLSISATTRPKRPSESEGVDYFFKSHNQFDEMVKNNEFLEFAHVFGNSYGTPKQQVYDNLENGFDVLFDIEWQGTQQLKQAARADVASVFILPPSTEELRKRLQKRAEDTEEVVNYRMSQATNEMSHWPEYDYILVNNNLEESVAKVKAILTAERLRRERQIDLPKFVQSL